MNMTFQIQIIEKIINTIISKQFYETIIAMFISDALRVLVFIVYSGNIDRDVKFWISEIKHWDLRRRKYYQKT